MWPSSLTKKIVIVGLFALAFVVRLVFVIQWNDMPYGMHPILDAEAYDTWAMTIADGHWLRSTAFYQSPLFPYLAGILYRVFGHDYLIIGLFNAILGVLTVGVLWRIADRSFGFLAGALTALLAVLYRPMVFYAAPVMKEELGLFLLSLFLLLALRALNGNKARDFIGCGAILGLFALVRGNALFLALLVPLLAFRQHRQASLKNSALFIGAMIAFVAPATLHNYIVSHDFVPVNYSYGFNLYIGNSPSADGTNRFPPGISVNPAGEESDVSRSARAETGRNLKPSEVSAYWRGRALDYAWQHPLRELDLLKSKVWFFISKTEAIDNYDLDFIQSNFPSILGLTFPGIELILCLAVFTLVATGKSRPQTVVIGCMAAAYILSVLPFYVTDRYQLPVVVFLLPLAGAAFPAAQDLIAAKKTRRLIMAGGAALGLLGLSLMRIPIVVDVTAYDWGVLSAIYADAGQDAEALKAMYKALALSPATMGEQSLVRGAYIEERMGHKKAVQRLLDIARDNYPNSSDVWYNYARMRALQGDFAGALAPLQQAVKLSPDNVLYHATLAHVYFKLGDRARATEVLNQGLALSPNDPGLLQDRAELQGD